MANPNQFKKDLLSMTAEEVVESYLFDKKPFIFRNHPDRLHLMRHHLSAQLKVKENNIVIVGSAQTGFSLAPDSFPRSFHAGSDIDVVVVDETLFDNLWHIILTWHYPRRYSRLPDSDWRWHLDRSRDI